MKQKYLKICLLCMMTTLSSHGYSEDLTSKKQNVLEDARDKVGEKHYQEALPYYHQALTANPNDSDLLIETARVEGWSGHHQQAINLLNQVLKVAPQRREDVLRPLGWQFIGDNKPEKAIPFFQEYLQNHPQDSDALKGLSEAQRPPAKAPTSAPAVPASLETARKKVDKKRFQESLPYYYQALAANPNNSDLLIETARVEGWSDHHQQAINLLNRVLKVAPQRRNDVLRPLGWQFIGDNKPEKAIPFFQEYLRSHPKDSDALKGLAEARRPPPSKEGSTISTSLQKAREKIDQKLDEEALPYYYQALAANPNDSDLLIEIARVEGWVGHHCKAINLLNCVLEVAPQRREDVLRPLGWQFIRDNRAAKAIPFFREYLNNHPQDTESINGLGEAYYNLGRMPIAFSYYETLLKMDPNSLAAQYGMAKIDRDLNNFNKAECRYKRILRLHPEESEARLGLARTYNWGFRSRLAAREYRRLIIESPENKTYLREYATAAYWANFSDAAIAILGCRKNAERVDALETWCKAKRGVVPTLSVYYDYFRDSDNVAIHSDTLAGNYPLCKNCCVCDQSIDVYSRYDQLHQNGVHINGSESLIGFNKRFGSLFNCKGGVLWTRLAVGPRQYGAWHTADWRFYNSWWPTDLWQIQFDAGNEIVKNVQAIENQVLYSSGFLSTNYYILPRTIIGVGGGYGKFNDDNLRRRVKAQIDFILFFNPRVTIGWRTDYFTDTDPTIRRGYYNPSSYLENKVRLGFVYSYNNWDLEGVGYLGNIRENPGGMSPLKTYEIALVKDFLCYGVFRAYTGYSTSINASTDQFRKGYSSRYAGIGYTVQF